MAPDRPGPGSWVPAKPGPGGGPGGAPTGAPRSRPLDRIATFFRPRPGPGCSYLEPAMERDRGAQCVNSFNHYCYARACGTVRKERDCSGCRRCSAAGSRTDTNRTDRNTTRSRDSGHHMRGRPLHRSLCDGRILVLCILPCSR
jgi:hypothetical protein